MTINIFLSSTSVKEILQRMLVINEEQRISWYELFDLDLVKSDDKKLKEELQNLSSESDSLERFIILLHS